MIRSMSSLYNGSKACVWMGNRVGEFFEVMKGLRQGYVMLPGFFNILFDRLVRQVNERAVGKGVKLRDEHGEG